MGKLCNSSSNTTLRSLIPFNVWFPPGRSSKTVKDRQTDWKVEGRKTVKGKESREEIQRDWGKGARPLMAVGGLKQQLSSVVPCAPVQVLVCVLSSTASHSTTCWPLVGRAPRTRKHCLVAAPQPVCLMTLWTFLKLITILVLGSAQERICHLPWRCVVATLEQEECIRSVLFILATVIRAVKVF